MYLVIQEIQGTTQKMTLLKLPAGDEYSCSGWSFSTGVLLTEPVLI